MVNSNLTLLFEVYLKQSLTEVLQCWCDRGGGLWDMLLNASLLCSREKLFHWCFLLVLLNMQTKQFLI